MAAESDGKKKAGTSRMGTCGKGIVFVACCVASAAALAATVTLNGETTYNVASGTNTVSDTLTGSGSILKTGNGALNLTGTGNDFTGGTKVNAGAVLASALDALGTGAVEVAAKTAGVWFNVAPATTGGYTLFGNSATPRATARGTRSSSRTRASRTASPARAATASGTTRRTPAARSTAAPRPSSTDRSPWRRGRASSSTSTAR